MITLPISVLTFIILILIAGPTLCALTTILTHRVDTKVERNNLDARRAAVALREFDLLNRVESVEGREWVAAERENMLVERRFELGERQLELSKKASDLDALVKAQVHLMQEDDTTIQTILDLSDIPSAS